MTAEELCELPPNGYKYELVEGELIRMPPTGGEHGQVAMTIGVLLANHVTQHDLGVVCAAETGFILKRLPDVVRAPDVSFVAKDRIPATGIPKTYWPFAPDLAVEVVSPSDRFEDIQTKVADYLAASTRLVWVVEPTTRTIFVYRSTRDLRSLGEEDELSGEDVLPGFHCPVRRVFV